MESKEFVRWQDQEALHRFQLISTLIAADADSAKRIAERGLRSGKGSLKPTTFQSARCAGTRTLSGNPGLRG